MNGVRSKLLERSYAGADLQTRAGLTNDYEDFALFVARRLFEDFGIKGEIKITSARGSCYQPLADKAHRVSFGRRSVMRAADLGFTEYKTIASTWAGRLDPDDSYMQVWALAIHEFAHVLHTIRGFRVHGHCHDTAFAHILRELQVAYAYSDFLYREGLG